jgi:hypothetical protein
MRGRGCPLRLSQPLVPIHFEERPLTLTQRLAGVPLLKDRKEPLSKVFGQFPGQLRVLGSLLFERGDQILRIEVRIAFKEAVKNAICFRRHHTTLVLVMGDAAALAGTTMALSVLSKFFVPIERRADKDFRGGVAIYLVRHGRHAFEFSPQHAITPNDLAVDQFLCFAWLRALPRAMMDARTVRGSR